jgi:hypothetical protein
MTVAARGFITWRTIALRGLFGEREVEACCFGDWAVHASLDVPDRYVLTLLPIGLCLPPDWCWFARPRDALRAMVAIARLKNSWAIVQQVDLTVALGQRLRAICAACGSERGPTALTIDADLTVAGTPAPRQNGYREIGAP